MGEDHAQNATEKATLGIFVLKATAIITAHDVGIVIKGVVMVQDLNDMASFHAMLFGLIDLGCG